MKYRASFTNTVFVIFFNFCFVLYAQSHYFYTDAIIEEGDHYPWPEKVYVYDTYPNTTTIEMTGGTIDEIFFYNSSRLSFSGGYIAWLNGQDTSTIEVHGGDVSRLLAYDSSVFNIYGGIFGQPGSLHQALLGASSSGVINIYGYGFSLAPAEVEGLVGDWYFLNGFWENGDPFRVGVTGEVYSNHVILHEIPEPTTLSLLAVGAFLVGRKRKA